MSGAPELHCERTREILWPLDGPRLCRKEEEAARRHLEGCAGCRAFFRRDAALGRALRKHGLAGRAPRALRERVFDVLARERGRRSGSGNSSPGSATEAGPARGRALGDAWLAWVPLVAAVALMAVFLGLQMAADGDAESAYVQDFLNRALEESTVVPEVPEDVSRFFRREMGVGIEPVQPRGARLSRAMICLIRGERAAMVEYELAGRTVAHYRLPLSRPAGDVGGEVRVLSEGGLTVIRWEDGAFEHALVGDLPRDRIVALARERFAAR